MKHNIIFTVLLSGLMIASCAAPQEEPLPGQKREIRLSGVIDNCTKVSESGFTQGDYISLSISAPVEGVTNWLLAAGENGEFTATSPIYWGAEQADDETADFVAIFPFGHDPMMPFTFNVMDNQRVLDCYTGSDLLWAITQAAPKDENVLLHFNHGMSRLVFKVDCGIPGERIVLVTLNGLQLTAEVDLMKGVIKGTGAEVKNLYPYEAETVPSDVLPGSLATTYVFLIPPQVASPEIDVYLESGNLIRYTADSPIDFVSGKQIRADIVALQDEAKFTGTLEDWDSSLTAAFGQDQEMARLPWQVARFTYWNNETQTVDMEMDEDGVYHALIEDYQPGEYLYLMADEKHILGDAQKGDGYPCWENEETVVPLKASASYAQNILLTFAGDVALSYDPREGVLRVKGVYDKRLLAFYQREDGKECSLMGEILVQDYATGDIRLFQDQSNIRINNLVDANGNGIEELGWFNDATSVVNYDVVVVKGTKATVDGEVIFKDVVIEKRLRLADLQCWEQDPRLEAKGGTVDVHVRHKKGTFIVDNGDTDWLTCTVTTLCTQADGLWQWDVISLTAGPNLDPVLPSDRYNWTALTLEMEDGSQAAIGFTTIQEGGLGEVDPDAVDLGLSVNWAPSNLTENGFASSPGDYGDYFAWGETETKDVYTWDNYKWCIDGFCDFCIKYCPTDKPGCWYAEGPVDGKIQLDPEDDPAQVILGGDWRMPTKEEWTELIDNCSWEWTTMDGVSGFKVTGKNGNSIFLPAAGTMESSWLSGEEVYGYYWSSSLCDSSESVGDAWDASFSCSNGNPRKGKLYGHPRAYGIPVRPVSD